MELSRFIDAVKFGDFSQGFSHRGQGSGFFELSGTLDEAIKRLRDERHKLIDANRFYEAVLDDAPTALLTVDGDGKVELANKAARRLFVRHKGVRVEDFRDYGDAFANALEGGAVGRPRLVPLLSDGVPQTMLVSAAIVHRLGGLVRVVAVQPIQGELNAIEIAAQSDLIRVLTHEIMNSMTPVTSLAHSAVDLMRGADHGENADIADARIAVETLARRADGVMHFVESYRQISRAPEIRARPIDVAAWGRELESLFRASDRAQGIGFTLAVDETSDPRRRPGPDEPGADQPDPQRRPGRARPQRGAARLADHDPQPPRPHRDRGRRQWPRRARGPQAGHLPALLHHPADGTGVGLSLARQVVLAHRGAISVGDREGGGALFRIVL